MTKHIKYKCTKLIWSLSSSFWRDASQPRTINYPPLSSTILHSLPNLITTLAAKYGVPTLASNAPTGSSSTKRVSAARSSSPVNNSTPRRVSARSAMRAISSSMESVPSKTNQPTIIKDAQSGRMESAPNAPRDGTSTNKKIVHPSVTYALSGVSQVPALNAITDTSSATANASLMMIEALFPTATSFAKHGLEKNAQNALKELTSTLMVFAAQSAHNATHSTKPLEPA